RNRIIAGLSLATIVIEASEKSGSLITARYANEYGRIVFSVPSNITNPYGKGTNNLIKEGAVPLTDIQDIYETVPYLKKNNVSPEHELSSIESVILELSSSPVHIDMLSEKSGIKVDDLMLILFDMEIKGIISIDNGMVLRNI
ncbi:MAG TPA: DNA-processing protein DprA, partial [Persephonella sp.]|nr:DNA-processing protein DprA [Persephonella sp.]